ncbi:unnamed protein product [Eretmochelys imbricata]
MAILAVLDMLHGTRSGCVLCNCRPQIKLPQLKSFQITVEKLPDPPQATTLLNRYSTDPQYQQLFINLEPYINKSAVSVQAHFSLQCTYIIFRTLGLRHLTVVDLQNRVVGIITRKDLMSFQLEERLACQLALQKRDSDEQPLD